MRIGIFGGTFNPIHIGHLVAAQRAQEKLKLDKVVFVPSHFPPHKSNKNVVAAKDRYYMVRLAIKGNTRFIVSDFEIKRETKSFSVDTVNHLTTQFSQDTKFFFIIGEDGLATLPSWKCIEELAAKVTFVVVHRPKCNQFSSRIKVRKVSMPGLEISSSEVRKRIKENKTVQYLVPEGVLRYIKKNNIY